MPAPCTHCGDAPKLLPSHRCENCKLLRESADVQMEAASARRERWIEAGSPKPNQAERKAQLTQGKKFCSYCGSWRRLDRAGVKLDWTPSAARCRPCSSLGNRSRAYKVSPDNFAALRRLQEGLCAVCGRAQRVAALAVDHEHYSQEVRGLLCLDHNQEIGLNHDNPLIFAALTAYLLDPPYQRVLGNGKTNEVVAVEFLRIIRELPWRQHDAN